LGDPADRPYSGIIIFNNKNMNHPGIFCMTGSKTSYYDVCRPFNDENCPVIMNSLTHNFLLWATHQFAPTAGLFFGQQLNPGFNQFPQFYFRFFPEHNLLPNLIADKKPCTNRNMATTIIDFSLSCSYSVNISDNWRK
jgi:hypothetical protein